jgi:hypothetical protein
VLAEGETATAPQANDALIALNDLVASLSNESLFIYQNAVDVITLDGASSYTIGESGTPDVTSSRPIKVNSVQYRDTNSLDSFVDVITLGEYNDIAEKTLDSDIVERVYVNATYPNATIYVYPVSSVGTLRVNSSKPIGAFSGLTTTVSLPPGYDRLLRYGLASELMVEYGLVNPVIEQRFIEAKTAIKRTNLKPSVLRTSYPFGRRWRGGRIESDGV